MKVSVEKNGPCRRTITVKVPENLVTEAYKEATDTMTGIATLPGFRKGKAPRKMVEARFGKDIEEEVKEKLVSSSFREALDQEDIKPVTILNLNHDHFNKDEAMVYSITLDIAPEFKLPKYKGISLK
ncbi:MAG: trigger factor family protein, partial [Lentisphaerae bacterium]|nr:trigger factor family protein [Lentisphaerota bacterium]